MHISLPCEGLLHHENIILERDSSHTVDLTGGGFWFNF
jgi:hypothetical protein